MKLRLTLEPQRSLACSLSYLITSYSVKEERNTKVALESRALRTMLGLISQATNVEVRLPYNQSLSFIQELIFCPSTYNLDRTHHQ